MIVNIMKYVANMFDWTSLIIVVTVCILLRRLFSAKRYSPPLPPSPTVAIPVIGHLHLLDDDMRKVIRKFRRQLGDIYSLQLGGRLGVVISRYETLKEAFIKQGEKFSDRPNMFVTDRIARKSGLVSTSGQVWKEHRRFCLSKLKDFGMGKSFLESKMYEETEQLIAEMREHCGEPFDPKILITTHVVNIISAMLFKGQFQHGDDRLRRLVKAIDFNIEMNNGPVNFLPWLEYLPGDPFKVKTSLKNADQLFNYAYEIIADHEKELDENNIDDLTSAYLHEWRRMKESGEQTTMSYENLACTLCDLFTVGFHTTVTTIRWAIPCLVTYPDIQEKLFKEVKAVVGKTRLPSMQDKSRLAYLEAFYLEVLRYCNLTILSLPRATNQDTVLNGFTIPQDSIIFPDLDSVFMDANIWGDPDVFRPERFIDDSGNIKKKDELIVFFFGKRSCVGEALAKMELLIFLGGLVQNFKFESCPGENLTVDKVDGVFGFVHGPKPYNILVSSR